MKWRDTSKINRIIVHHSASDWGCAVSFDKDHRARGFEMIGYHIVILNGYPWNDQHVQQADGYSEFGRPFNAVGAHATGHNTTSLGICLVGNGSYTNRQIEELFHWHIDLMEEYGITVPNVVGHYEVDPKRKPDCPMINMDRWRYYLDRGTLVTNVTEIMRE